MKSNTFKLNNEKKTYVMSLIGISDKTYKNNTYALLKKLTQSYPPEFIADLSILNLKNKESLWRKIIHETDSYATTLPCYYISKKSKCIDRNELLDIAIEQMEEGVKIMTIHLTPNKLLSQLSKSRLVPCTSRGGHIILQDLINSDFKRNNAYIDILPELIGNAKKNNTIISIGASYRSSNIFDSLDLVQTEEINMQLEFAEYIDKNGVEVIIETPGHASPRNILKIAEIFKASNYPLMPLGPIITDIGIGMDHITAAIGATILGMNSNVKIIAAVTEEEHTGNIPNDTAIINALKTAKMTAHILDMYRYEDYEKDYIIAKDRSINKTCIYQSNKEGCKRCDKLCPLI